MIIFNVITKNGQETIKLGEKLSKRIKKGDIIALIGDLGSGKTTLTKGIARGLSVQGYVRSPSFKLINEYKGSIPIFHFDWYRLNNISELEGLGYKEYFYNKGVTIIEWAEKIKDVLPYSYWQINLFNLGETKRKIIVKKVNPVRKNGVKLQKCKAIKLYR